MRPTSPAQDLGTRGYARSQSGQTFRNLPKRTFGVRVPLLLPLLITLLALAASAQFQPESFSTRSVSGQFLVHVAPGTQYSFAPSNFETNAGFIRLDPTLVPVSCERIKQILWRELEAKPPYSGKVFVTIYPSRGAEQPIAINAEPFSDGWQYSVILPNLIERVRYVRTIVQVVLVEMANRGGVTHAAEVPLWLVEGLTQELLASREIQIILPPPNTPANNIRLTYTPLDARRANPLEKAHQVLTRLTPLSFQQMSWPADEQLVNAGGERFSCSAQLFVHQLLEFTDGGSCLRSMLSELSRHYNWQLAFLTAFHSHFGRPLDVEKWWALEVAHFTGRDLTEAWSMEEGWQKLQDAIHPAVQIRTGTNELPLEAQVSLQSVIREWPANRQPPALQAKLRELESLRLRLTKDLAPLVDEYRQVISAYLENRQHTGFFLFRKQPSAQEAAPLAIRQLDTLDARFEALRPVNKPSAQAKATAVP